MAPTARGFILGVLAVLGILAFALSVSIGATLHAMQGQRISRDLATVCANAGKSWVQNTNGDYECR